MGTIKINDIVKWIYPLMPAEKHDVMIVVGFDGDDVAQVKHLSEHGVETVARALVRDIRPVGHKDTGQLSEAELKRYRNI